MRKVEQIRVQVEQLAPDVRCLFEEQAAAYEEELTQVTGKLSLAYEELVLLYNLGESISSILDVDQITSTALDEVRELLDVRDGCVVLTPLHASVTSPTGEAGGEGSRVEIKPPYQVQTVTSPLVGQNVRIIEEASQIVLERGRPLIVNDVHAHYGLRNGSIRNLLSAPMRARDRVVGIIHVYDKAIGEGFSSEDQKLLAAIAAQAGVAIDNSRLVEKERQKAREVEETTYNALEALSVALDLRDTETQGHSRRVTDYTVRLAREFDISPEELIIIERGALLHDIGKIGVPDDILRKPGKLTEEEWVIMRLHPGLGYRIMGRVNFLAPSASIVLHHHERYDGQGYPHRLRGEDIPLGARAFAVADTLDAMTSDRPYRKALPYEVARAEIEKNAGTQFDPAVVDVFLRVPEEEWQAIRQRVNETYGDTKEDLAKMAEV